MATIPDTTVQVKNGGMITIRSARPEDAHRLLDHVRPIFAEEEFLLSTPEDFRMTEEQEAAWLEMNYRDPGKLVLVSEDAGQIIGMLDFHDGGRKRTRHQGEFGISINKAWRDQGVGRAMLLALISWAEQHPVIEKLNLAVLATNTRAIALYSSLGFQEEGRLQRQIKLEPGVYVDMLLMGRFVNL